MSKQDTAAKNTQNISVGLLFELEYIAISGRRELFEACRRTLKEEQINLTPQLFIRYCLRQPGNDGLTRLFAGLNQKLSNAAKLAEKIQNAYLQNITQTGNALNPAFDKLLMEAEKHSFKIGVISALPANTAQELLAKYKLQERVKLHVQTKKTPAPSAETWRTLARLMDVSPKRSVILADSAAACHSALQAGTRCAVIPNEFTEHQDFSGADLIVENIQNISIKDLSALLKTCSFR